MFRSSILFRFSSLIDFFFIDRKIFQQDYPLGISNFKLTQIRISSKRLIDFEDSSRPAVQSITTIGNARVADIGTTATNSMWKEHHLTEDQPSLATLEIRHEEMALGPSKGMQLLISFSHLFQLCLGIILVCHMKETLQSTTRHHQPFC